jgi:hypothetical protein
MLAASGSTDLRERLVRGRVTMVATGFGAGFAASKRRDVMLTRGGYLAAT